MRDEQLEAWVLSIVDQVTKGQHVEDSRVELKAEWPDPKQAARRIAGHVNASGGESVLWIIGLDEKRGVVPFTPVDVAEWSAQLSEQFDGIAPQVKELFVSTAAGGLMACLFETSRRPFVVKNSAHGTKGGGPVSLEVPWRDGTAVRSARREDLIRILVPFQALPKLEILSASASVSQSSAVSGYPIETNPIRRETHFAWHFGLFMYVTPRTSVVVVFPTHKASFSFALGHGLFETVSKLHLHPPHHYSRDGLIGDSQTITATSSEAIIAAPGRLHIECTHYAVPKTIESTDTLVIALSLIPAGQDRSIDQRLNLSPKRVEREFNWSWEWLVEARAKSA